MKFTRLNELIEDGKKVKGRWRLTPKHELQYTSEGKKEEIKLKGSLVTAEPDALVFSVTEKQEDQRIVTTLAKLTGTWKLNSKNQISFEVEKEAGQSDVLTFSGGWNVNESHEIVYRYDQTQLKTKTRLSQELVFKGHWDISGKNELTYYLGADSASAFRLRGAFQTHSILAKDGEIRYQIGAEAVSGKRTRTISLFGKWKISRDAGLLFEIEYSKRSKKALRFGGEYRISGDQVLSINLKTRQGEKLGVELVMTKELARGEAFLRLSRSPEGSNAEAGMRLDW